MLTSNPISTISYNSEPFLKDVLSRLTKSGIICEWYYIAHKGEIDDFTNEREKDHIHLYMRPSKRLDTEELRKHFLEIDPNNAKPLGIMPCNSEGKNGLDHWILYGIHDVQYLNSKGECKEFEYHWKCIQGYDEEAILRAVKHAKADFRREMNRRQFLQDHTVEEAWDLGIIKTSEVVSCLALERMRENRQAIQTNANAIKASHKRLEDENPFEKEKKDE